MDYYDENGNKLDKEDLVYLQRLTFAVSESESEIIESFLKVEPIYLLLKDKGEKLTPSQLRKVNKEFQEINFEYGDKLSIWSKHNLNPFDRYSFKIEHKGTKYFPHVNILPQSLKQIQQYLDFTSGWIHNVLLEIKDKPFEIYSESNYLSDFDRFTLLTEEVINNEIERVVNHITLLVNELNLNTNLIDYVKYYENLTIDIDFFKIKRIDRIENIWGLTIGMGILLGDYKYLSYLNRKKRDYTQNNRYVLKDNHSYYSEFSDLELEKIYKRLVEEEYIEEMDNPNDFVKIFKEARLTEIKPITWKKVKNRWLSILTLIELLVKPDYSNTNLFRHVFGYCFNFRKNENITDDIGKSIKEPFEKVSEKNKLDDKIKKIVGSH